MNAMTENRMINIPTRTITMDFDQEAGDLDWLPGDMDDAAMNIEEEDESGSLNLFHAKYQIFCLLFFSH